MVSKVQLQAIKVGLNTALSFVMADKSMNSKEKACCIRGMLYGAKLAFDDGVFPEEMNSVVFDIEKKVDSLTEGDADKISNPIINGMI